MTSDEARHTPDRPFRMAEPSIPHPLLYVTCGHKGLAHWRPVPAGRSDALSGVHCCCEGEGMSIAEKILERCSRPGGSDRASLIALFRQYQRTEARHRIDQLVDTGDVLRFTRRPANGKGRDAQQYFTDAADGQRWASEQNVEPRAASVRKALRKAAPKPVPLTISKKRERVTVLAADADADVIVPAGLKVQVIPGMPAVDPRYQVDPNTRVVGGFASLGPGRYLEDTRP